MFEKIKEKSLNSHILTSNIILYYYFIVKYYFFVFYFIFSNFVRIQNSVFSFVIREYKILLIWSVNTIETYTLLQHSNRVHIV